MSSLRHRRRKMDRRPASIRIDICCNDPDNGLFRGRAIQIALPDQLLSLEARAWDLTESSEGRCPRLRYDDGSIVLSGKRWPILGSIYGVGNWCWDSWEMGDQPARQFLVWLHRRRLFRVDEAATELFEAWQSDEPLPLEPDQPIATGPLGQLLAEAAWREPR